MKLQWVENIVQIRKLRRVYNIFTGKSLEKQLLGEVKRLENTGNIKMEFREMGCEDTLRRLAQDRIQCWSFVLRPPVL
jgi:hypothetical protein